ncbi:MAG: hypothetical protein ABSF45_03465 [Terriglobia bacterium]|jgi:hypothetical protein
MGAALRTTFIVAFLAVSGGFSDVQAQKHQPPREQTIFYEGKPFKYPVPLSPAVLNVLVKTVENQREMGIEDNSRVRSNPAKLFRATEVHLDGLNEIDLVIIGLPPMRGVDTGWFWLVRSTPNNPKILLWATGNSIQVMDSKTNGYCDISSAWASASETLDKVYHFDGKEYMLWKEKRMPIR